MCGIAGVLDLAGHKTVAPSILRKMADAIYHRGPDEDGYLERPGLGLANRRLSIVGLADGQQPIANEDGTVWTVFNGEFFDYPEKRAALEAKGHVFKTSTDTELIPHMYEEYGEGMFEQLRGQFAICVWDSKTNTVLLGRDRMGICPLFYAPYTSKAGDDAGTNYLIFASEMKGILASGLIPRRPNIRGINQVMSFLAVPGPVTCFDGITLLLPGHYLKFRLDGSGTIEDKTYWEIDFPDWGQEEDPPEKELVDQFERVFLGAVERRLRADVPVVSYLSGGVDSSVVVALATKVLGRPIPTFTISVQAKGLNEEHEAAIVAKHIGSQSIIVPYGHAEVRDSYPDLIAAAEVPVVDTSCAALMMLARSVRANGYKVALTGEGADETMAGYWWFKAHKIASKMDLLGFPISDMVRRLALKVTGQPSFPQKLVSQTQDIVGGHNGWLDLYGVMGLSKLRFYKKELRQTMALQSPFADIGLNTTKLKRWHPFNRALMLGQRIMLAGHLLCSKGDRVAMSTSVETRYPFLDEEVVAFLAKLHPRWKLRGLTEKYLLRLMAARHLPKQIAWRRKAMFRAPMDSFHLSGRDVPKWIDEVLSPEAIRKTDIFDYEAVAYHRKRLPTMMTSLKRTSVEMGLVAVTATQLWHHLYISGDLSSLPSRIQ